MALALKRLDVDSVPLNFLVPIRGTPLEKAAPISACDALKTIALFRIILKDKNIRVAAGREKVFSDIEAMMFFAGATGMMIGGYLTTNGRSAAQDVSLARKTEELWKKGSKKK
jgi:biotin synthase